MWDSMVILTIEDVARYLRADAGFVRQLIETGRIPSFDVDGTPRMLAGALIDWFQTEMHLKSLETLKRTLQNKETWARALQEDSELRAELEKNQYEEGTFGSFLKAAAKKTNASTGSPSMRKPTQPRQAVNDSGDAPTEIEEDSGRDKLPRSQVVQRTKHVFVSYVRENEPIVNRLCDDLRRHGINVWRDREAIKPGQRWQRAIQSAIRDGTYFIACFSRHYSYRSRTYMNEELTVAIEELRTRHPDKVWFIPVRLDNCKVPRSNIGAGEDLTSLQWVDLFSDWGAGITSLVRAIGATRNAVSPP
jgi:hypothetical protein